MRYTIIADLHANLEALSSAFSYIDPQDQIWCLGDVVGYGPNPNECAALIQEGNIPTVIGNHDLAVVERLETTLFNSMARWAIEWTRKNLTRSNKKYLESLPGILRPILEVTLVHGSPRDPVWEYLLNVYDIHLNFDFFDTKICFVGHSHIPFVFEKRGKDGQFLELVPGQVIKLNRQARYIINPGSIGQPRDNDPRASFMVFDKEAFTIEHFRFEYPIQKTQDKMKTLEFPRHIIDRLTRGQ